ncbi:MAG: GNAT family N-acetyltransferase [Lachnospiraceae bacterium]|nr:GNAT family N-acetyltransferase [Lachnospiraceae bacterium]
MIVRIAREQDMPRLLDIYNYEVLNGVATFDLHAKTMEERMEWFRAHNKDNHPLIVAEIDGCTAGYATLSPYREKEAYAATVELSVYVDTTYRRRGVARRLMADILAEARARKDIHTVISVITGDNAASVALHKEFGFEYCGTMKEVGEKFGRLLDVVNYQLMV